LIAALNEGADTMGGKINKYIGPIKWDIGGAVTKVSAADWACWTQAKLSVTVCRERYMKEIEAKKSGIILVHDINKKTAEMLIGDGKKTGLIDQALAKGYKFVPINKAGDD